jgi:hypothetical protein
MNALTASPREAPIESAICEEPVGGSAQFPKTSYQLLGTRGEFQDAVGRMVVSMWALTSMLMASFVQVLWVLAR